MNDITHIPTLLDRLRVTKDSIYLRQMTWLNRNYLNDWIQQYKKDEKHLQYLIEDKAVSLLLSIFQCCKKEALEGSDKIILKGDYQDITEKLGITIFQIELLVKDFFEHLGFNIKDVDRNTTIVWNENGRDRDKK